jgi:ankyrin repeat protein
MCDFCPNANIYRDEENISRYALICFRTPLMLAAEAGNVAAARLLLEHGADPEAWDYHGCTALIRAVRSGYLPIVKLFVKAGADVNRHAEDGPLPLLSGTGDRAANHYSPPFRPPPEKDREKIAAGVRAIFANYTAIVQYLVDAGADVNLPGPRGEAALFNFVILRRSDLLQMVIAVGADVHRRDDDGNTALHRLVKGGGAGHEWSEDEDAEILRILLDAGIEQDARDGEGKTALEWAVEKDKTWLIPLLSR